MTWTDIRRLYPHQWLLIEALLAHSKEGKRLLDELAVVNAFPDGEAALRAYLKLHRTAPMRELYVVHSDGEDLQITERFSLSPRTAGFEVPPELEAELMDSIAEADRGETISAEELIERLRRIERRDPLVDDLCRQSSSL